MIAVDCDRKAEYTFFSSAHRHIPNKWHPKPCDKPQKPSTNLTELK